MCITFFCLLPSTGKSKNIQFIIGFNRDEQTKRQTIKFGSFAQDPNIYAGRDLISGGTWLGLNVKTGIMVFLTNHHQDNPRMGLSRGQLVKSFLSTNFVSKQDDFASIESRIFNDLKKIGEKGQQYSAFNLVVYHLRTSKCFYISSEETEKEPEILKTNKNYGLCNTYLHTMWPKTTHGLKFFSKMIQNLEQKNGEEQIMKDIQAIMKDTKSFDEDPEQESSIFINEYYSEEQKALRKTKSTFIGVFRREKEFIRANIKQITFQTEEETIVKKNFFF